MADVLVLVEDIAVTRPLEAEAKRLGGGMTSTLSEEHSAMFVLPTQATAHDFIFYCWQQGYQARIQEALFPGVYTPLDALREDAQRIRRALKKPGAKPPWAR